MDKRILWAAAFAAILAATVPAAVAAKSSHDSGGAGMSMNSGGGANAQARADRRAGRVVERRATPPKNESSSCNSVFRNDTRPEEECGGE